MIIADESMTKQIRTITQKYKLWDNCFYLYDISLLLLFWNFNIRESSLKNTNVINIDTTCKAALVSARYTRLPVTMRPCEAMLTIWVAADTA